MRFDFDNKRQNEVFVFIRQYKRTTVRVKTTETRMIKVMTSAKNIPTTTSTRDQTDWKITNKLIDWEWYPRFFFIRHIKNQLFIRTKCNNGGQKVRNSYERAWTTKQISVCQEKEIYSFKERDFLIRNNIQCFHDGDISIIPTLT